MKYDLNIFFWSIDTICQRRQAVMMQFFVRVWFKTRSRCLASSAEVSEMKGVFQKVIRLHKIGKNDEIGDR